MNLLKNYFTIQRYLFYRDHFKHINQYFFPLVKVINFLVINKSVKVYQNSRFTMNVSTWDWTFHIEKCTCLWSYATLFITNGCCVLRRYSTVLSIFHEESPGGSCSVQTGQTLTNYTSWMMKNSLSCKGDFTELSMREEHNNYEWILCCIKMY